jgi:lambda repressor-like predicted transcriptional regulator
MRQNLLKVYLDDEEWDRVVDMADAVAMPLSGYVRAFLMTQKPPAPKAKGVTAEAVAALNRNGALLNQLARIGHTSKTLSAADLRELTAARERLIAIAKDLNGNLT